MFVISWTAILVSAIIITQVVGKGGAAGLVGGLGLYAATGPGAAMFAGIGLGCLFAALLSAGDIFLIVATQAIHNNRYRNETNDNDEADQLAYARRVVFILAVCSFVVVGILKAIGAGVADLIFVLYGSSTALLPSVLCVLFGNRQSIERYAPAAVASTVCGVIIGWSYGILAIYSTEKYRAILQWLDLLLPGEPTSFNAAFTALAWASIIFAFAAAMCTIQQKKHMWWLWITGRSWQ